MGFRLAVSGGAENINLDEKTIQKVTFSSDSATDSNARATDFGIAVKITGKMLYKVGADGEDGTLGYPNGLRFRPSRQTATEMHRSMLYQQDRW